MGADIKGDIYEGLLEKNAEVEGVAGSLLSSVHAEDRDFNCLAVVGHWSVLHFSVWSAI